MIFLKYQDEQKFIDGKVVGDMNWFDILVEWLKRHSH